MIPVEQLRVGNFALNNKGEVVEISVSHLLYISNNPDNKYSGIPLTAEWLERLGFAVRGGFMYDNGEITIMYMGDCVKFLAGPRHVDFHYVHQLQNLYYSLTGNELEIKKTSS